MKQSTAGDHISSSLTDLMTSLLVIFILLLVAKLNSQAKRTGRTVEYVARSLKAAQLFKAGEKMRQDGDVIFPRRERLTCAAPFLSWRRWSAETMLESTSIRLSWKGIPTRKASARVTQTPIVRRT